MPRKPKHAERDAQGHFIPAGGKPDVESDTGGAFANPGVSDDTGNESGIVEEQHASDAINEPPAAERFVDPVESAATAKRKPGRPLGSRTTTNTAKSEKATPLPVTFSFVDIIASLHQMAAAGLEVPELVLAPSEAQKLAEACEQVSKFYSVSVDPKKAALFNLFIVAGGIYTTRFMAWRLRIRSESSGQLHVMPNPGVPGAQNAPAGPAGRNGAPAAAPQRPSDLWPQSGEFTGPAF